MKIDIILKEGSMDELVEVMKVVGVHFGPDSQIRIAYHPDYHITREQAASISHKLAVMLNGTDGLTARPERNEDE